MANRIICCFTLLIVASPLMAQGPPIVQFAEKYVGKQPTGERQLGLAEIRRAHGMKAADESDARGLELACWRMLPVASAQREAFRQRVAKLKAAQPSNRWVAVWELYLLAGESDRAALHTAIERMPTTLPERFPGKAGEDAHFNLLREIGTPRLQAGMQVIAARNHEPLHALRDLDRALLREADFLHAADRRADADAITQVRNRLRQSYRDAAHHLVEKLFALQLLGEVKQRDALLAESQGLTYLHDRQKLTALLERMDEERAWTRLIQPLLESELKLIANPPDIGELPLRSVAAVPIKADKKIVLGKTVRYEGNVRFHLHAIEISCQQLTLLQDDDPAAVILIGTGKGQLRGIAEYPHGIFVDRVAYQAQTGTFTLSGDVRMHGYERMQKLRACTLTQRGEVRDAISLLDDFRQMFTLDAKIELLPKISRVYADDELPPDVRYLLALNLLRPHFDWHAPYLPPLPEQIAELEKRAQHKEAMDLNADRDYFSTWREACRGEPWMQADVSDAAQDAFRAKLRTWYERANNDPRNKSARLLDLPIPGKDQYFWRIRDLRHADIARATRLLSGIHTDDLNAKASRWREEIARNNTVLTFDIPRAAQRGKPHRLLMDARNAEQVTFKLYRVEQPEELLYATKRIGKDFIYRDHGLDLERKRNEKVFDRLDKQRMRSITQHLERHSKEDAFEPAWKASQLVHQWDVRIVDLKVHRVERERRGYRDWDDEHWYDEVDAHYFDDACSAHQLRINKDYRPEKEDQLSSWQCDRIVEIPGRKLSEAGAYVLIAESNGMAAHVPIVVDPLSLTLRRCRDGVFLLASDAAGTKPLANAQVYTLGQRGEAKTDEHGAAFARVFAAGDRAIVVHHQGRYAIGGFGQVFEGIYSSPYDDDHRWMRDRMKRARLERADAKEAAGSVYEDQHVVVAYTDRPTYRPGQDVQFKLIVRKLAPDKATTAATSFRGDEFDRATKMELPNLERAIQYAVIDPKGREIEQGSLALSDFGTAAGSIKLNHETVLGAYTFRVHVAGQWRVVPEVFAVKHYRRPNFEVLVEGVPEKLAKPNTLTLKIASQYYFGPPVNGGVVEVCLVRGNAEKRIVKVHEKLDAKGHAKVDLRLPKALDAGKYFVVCSVTDESGRTVNSSMPFTLEPPDAPAGARRLDALPRLVEVGQEIKIATKAKEIRAEQKITSLRFAATDGVVHLKLPTPGWYRLRTDDDETTIFAYGGKEHPRTYAADDDDDRDEGPAHSLKPKWVNLSDFAQEEQDHLSRWEKPAQHLYALFDRQALDVGDKLRLLVYVPQKEARLLFTMEGRTVLDYAVLDADANGGAYQIVELPMKDRYYPNIYLQGRVLTDSSGELGEQKQAIKKLAELRETDDEDTDPRWCRIDVRRAKGTAEQSGLNVSVTTDRADYKPGDSVGAVVKVTARDGQPRAAEVSFAAVDESVFAFGEDGLDGLPSFFGRPYETRRFQPKAWRTSIGKAREKSAPAKDIRELMLAQKHDQAMNMKSASKSIESLDSTERTLQFTALPLPRLHGEMPSGQIPLARLREHFHETATWIPQLRTDESGTARVTFTLPDSLTRYRLTSVALTKTTEVGVGRVRITAAMPLAVQAFLPRFAVERDRVQAIGIVHNHGDQARICQIAWQIESASIDEVEAPLKDWKLSSEHGKLTAVRTVQIAARANAKLGLWLKLDQIGTAKIVFRASDGKDGDAEVRTLPVQALGKPAEVNANEALAAIPVKAAIKEVAGTFNKEGRIQLPKGFLATDIHLSLACSEVAQALEGLDYLVEYPHGCIEQTMSRFMPVVMIKHATRTSPLKLRPEIEAKLPDILQTGLTRVYGHQHDDGSWGWFERDGRNFSMSVYVVYGLARCQAAGTKVDAEKLRRGCRYLQEELRANKQEPALAARAWYALALAGHANARELAAWAKPTLAQSPRGEVYANIALACRSAGLVELGEQAYRHVKQWQPHDAEMTALKLNTQIAYGAVYSDCRATAGSLLGRRQGTIWNNTRDTSWAIESLANMLGFLPEKNLIRKIEVKLAGKKVLSVTDAAELKKAIHRIHLQGAELPAQEALEIRTHVESDEPIHVAFRAVGVQRLDEVKPSGAKVQLTRTLESLDGEPRRGPLKIGEVVRVRLCLHLADREEYVMIEERRPTLCEFADEHVSGAAMRSAVHQEFRDDRLCVFFAALSAGTHEVVYYLRAETLGSCTVLPGCAFPMYSDKNRGETGSSKVAVIAK